MRGSDPTHAFIVSACVLILAGAIAHAGLSSKPARYNLFDGFAEGWESQWKEKSLARRPNRFELVDNNGAAVLRVESDRSASGLYRKIDIEPLESGVLSWEWRVERSLTENKQERTKAGDDYAARVLVIFRKHFLPWKIEAISYVWAGNDTVGAVFPNPYSKNTATIVLRNGDEEAGTWVVESRDVVDDYYRYFGRPPKKLAAVAVVVDTDNTEAEVTAWFDGLILETESEATK